MPTAAAFVSWAAPQHVSDFSLPTRTHSPSRAGLVRGAGRGRVGAAHEGQRVDGALAGAVHAKVQVRAAVVRALPVLPTSPSVSPTRTRWPGATSCLSRWA